MSFEGVKDTRAGGIYVVITLRSEIPARDKNDGRGITSFWHDKTCHNRWTRKYYGIVESEVIMGDDVIESWQK